MLEDALPQIAGEEEAVRPVSAKGRKESQVRHTQVLRFINNNVVEDRFLALGNDRRQQTEEMGTRDQICRTEPFANTVENRPQHGALLFRQSSLPAKPPHIAVAFPGFQLPRIDDLLPFTENESQTEFVTGAFGRRLREKLSHLLC